jgi:hypothetical protein
MYHAPVVTLVGAASNLVLLGSMFGQVKPDTNEPCTIPEIPEVLYDWADEGSW